MPQSLDPDQLIEQGARDEGYKPSHAEVPLAAATFSLREAIYAFPQGCTEDEYREWVDEMRAIMERATRRGQALSKNDETLGVVFFPWVLYRFYLLHEEYKKNSLPFNLRTILVYDANLYESCVSQESIRACHENPEFGLEYKWMTLFVDKWNADRSERGLPLLRLDSTMYTGRYAYFAECQTVGGSPDEIPSSELVTLPDKLPISDSTSTPDVDNGDAETPVTQQNRGRSLIGKDVSNSNLPDATTSDSRSTSTGAHSSSTPVRRSSRRRAMSRSRVPHTVSELNALSNAQKPKKKVTLDVAPSLETSDTEATSPEPEPTPPEPVLNQPSASSPTHQCEDSATCHCHSAQENVKFIYKRAVEGGVKCILNADGTWSIIIPHDRDRKLKPGSNIMGNRSRVLFSGPRLMPYLFWAHLPQDKRLDSFQPSLVPCLLCALAGFPCFTELGTAVGCVRCKRYRTGCSMTFTKGKPKRSIKSPYDRMLARHMLCWQIHMFMEGGEPFFIYREHSGYNFMPGVLDGYMPATRPGTSKQRDALIFGRHNELSALGSLWTGKWLGMDYIEAKKTWELLKEEGPDSPFAIEVLAKTPGVGSMLPSRIAETLNRYYARLAHVEQEFKRANPGYVVGGNVSRTVAGDPDDPSLSGADPDGNINVDTESEMSVDSDTLPDDSDDDTEGSIDDDYDAESSVRCEGESASAVSALGDEVPGDIVMDEVGENLNELDINISHDLVAQAAVHRDVSASGEPPQRRPTTPPPTPVEVDDHDPTPQALHSRSQGQMPVPASLLQNSSHLGIAPPSQSEDQITFDNVPAATSQELQSQPADGKESLTTISSQEYEELQQIRAVLPTLLVEIAELRVGFAELGKKHEKIEARCKHEVLRVEAMEAELADSTAQIALIREQYRDRDRQTIRKIAEFMDGFREAHSETVQSAVTSALENILQFILPSDFNTANTSTSFDSPRTSFLSPHCFTGRRTSENPSTHSAEQPIPIPPPGPEIGTPAIARIATPLATPVSSSSHAIGLSHRIADRTEGNIEEQ